MYKRNFKLKKLLAPSDGIAIVVIIVGLMIAIFLPELAIRLIGVSVAILGGVALFMLISQRMKEFVDSKYTPAAPPPDFKITVRKDTSARRQVIEDFDDSFGPDEAMPIENMEEYQDENIKILKKGAKKVEVKQKPAIQPRAEVKEDFEFTDEISGIRIIKKDKKSEDEEDTKQIETYEKKREAEAIDNNGNGIKKEKPAAKTNGEKEEVNLFSQHAVTAPKEDKAEKEKEIELINTLTKNYIEKNIDIPFSMLIESDLIAGQEPRKEFEYFLERVLKVIRSVTSTRTAIFMLVNVEKRELIIESFNTDVPEAITQKRKLSIGSDVVSQIVTNFKPEILTEINPSAELDLLPYYISPVGTSSFIGVPVFFNNSIIGVLCADSEVMDAYDAVTVGFLGHFTKLIGALVHSYTEKYELMQSSKILDAINQFRELVNSGEVSLDKIYDYTVETASNIFEFTTIGICAYDDNSGRWIIKALRTRDDAYTEMLGKSIDFENSLIGKSINAGQSIMLAPIEQDYLRIFESEDILHGGFFASAPLKSITSCYGSLFIEGRSSTSFTTNDMTLLENLADNSGNAIEQLMMVDIFRASSLVDTSTGILNQKAFYQRIDEEIIKSFDYNTIFTLCLFEIDNYASFDPAYFRDRAERVFYHVISIIRRNLRPYDIFGRISGDTYGIILPGINLKDAQVWAERLRLEIARSVLEIKNKKFSVTVSIGLARSGNTENVEELVNNAQKVLSISVKKRNCVSVFA